MTLPSELVSLLGRCAVHPSKAERVRSVLAKFIADGASRLQLVADFDHTMSAAVDDEGQRCLMVHEILEEEVKRVEPEAAARMAECLATHSPAIGHRATEETLAKVEPAELEVRRQEWWWQLYGHLVAGGHFSKPRMDELVKASRVELRPWCRRTMDACREAGVPLRIVSAGITDLIRSFLELREGLPVPEGDALLQIISNRMTYDEEGCASGFAEPIVHCWNKAPGLLPAVAAQRPNVLLCGDSLGDLPMAEGLCEDLCELRLGFFNHEDEAKREKFLQGYDVVLPGRASWDLHHAILRAVAS